MGINNARFDLAYVFGGTDATTEVWASTRAPTQRNAGYRGLSFTRKMPFNFSQIGAHECRHESQFSLRHGPLPATRPRRTHTHQPLMATPQRFQFDRFRRYEAIARNFRSESSLPHP
jgi:hypothetical protein